MATARTRHSPTTAIAWLRARIVPPGAALEALASIHALGEMLVLFEHYFPREFEMAQGNSITSDGDRRQLLVDFFRLVDARLFPLDDSMTDVEDCALPLWIPLPLVNREWWGRDYSELAPLEQAILRGAGVFDEYGRQSEDPDYAGFMPALSYARLARKCRRRGKPLCWLDDAARIVAHDTDTGWLDVTADESGDACESWDVRTIDAIARNWKVAQKFIARWRALQGWLIEGDLTQQAARFRSVQAMIEDCLIIRQRARVETRGKVETAPARGRPLIEVLADEDHDGE